MKKDPNKLTDANKSRYNIRMATILKNIKSLPESNTLVLIKKYILNDLDNYRGYNVENVVRCEEVYAELKTLKMEHLISDIFKAYYFDYTNDEYVNFDLYIVLSILNHKVSVSADFAYTLCRFCILNKEHTANYTDLYSLLLRKINHDHPGFLNDAISHGLTVSDTLNIEAIELLSMCHSNSPNIKNIDFN